MKYFGLPLVVLLLIATWSFGFEPGWLQERELHLNTNSLKSEPLTIAVATDLHVGAPHAGLNMLREVVGRINAARPDLILLPGDFMIQNVIGGQPVMPEVIAAELAHLRAPLGVFATLGNHDWWFDGPRVRQALEKVGITVIENGAIPLPIAGQPLWLVGIGDDMTGHANPAKAFSNAPPDAQVIAMMHDPANAPVLPGNTLVAFAGHTHGGQLRLPFLGALITPGRAPRGHAYGWIPDTPAPTWVSSGVGTSIIPIRLNCPPEIVILKLGNFNRS